MFWSKTFISIDWTFALTPPELGIVNVPQTDNGNVGQISNNGFNSVVELYYGYAKDLFPDIEHNKDFGDIFVDKLREKYLEKQCSFCKNKVPNEGIVLRIDELGSRALKLKSFAFLQKETKELDKGNVDMEEEN